MYKNNRACESCGLNQTRFLPEMSAAFEETRQWNTPCPKCGSLEWESLYWETPELNKRLMEKWSQDEGLRFMYTEEGVSLAEKENLPLLVQFLDSDQTLASKRVQLIEALCVLLFDNVPKINGRNRSKTIDPDVAIKVKSILKHRMDLFKRVKQDLFLEDYIKEIVYPELDVSRV